MQSIRVHQQYPLSEEPSEAANKFFKQFREKFARKNSRENNLNDVFRRMSVCSDPLLLNYYFKIKKNFRKRTPLDPSIIDCLKETGPNQLK